MNVNNSIKRLARRHCANYTEGGRCLLEPNRQPYCNFFRTDEQAQPFIEDGTMRCFYIEKHVLPVDKALETKYFNKDTAKCAVCSAGYDRKSNRQRYCPQCSEEKRRERARFGMRRIRRGRDTEKVNV